MIEEIINDSDVYEMESFESFNQTQLDMIESFGEYLNIVLTL